MGQGESPYSLTQESKLQNLGIFRELKQRDDLGEPMEGSSPTVGAWNPLPATIQDSAASARSKSLAGLCP